jgi:hypothetical protein
MAVISGSEAFAPVTKRHKLKFQPFNGSALRAIGMCVVVAYGGQHCIGRCNDPRDCSATPLPSPPAASKPKPVIIAPGSEPEPPEPVRPSMASIGGITAAFYGLELHDLKTRARGGKINKARQVAFYLCRKLTIHSYPKISRAFCRTDHSTSWHAFAKITRLLRTDAKLADEVAEIRRIIAVRYDLTGTAS